MTDDSIQQWNRYSPIWRNILTKVLEWRADAADEFIEKLREDVERWENEPHSHYFQFFFDLPSKYLFGHILGGGLQETISNTKNEKANPHQIYKILARAIAGGLERNMEKEDFDWSKARQRYIRSRRRIEKWLASLQKKP